VAEPQLDSIETWFVERGLPHFVERRAAAADIWARALPLLVAAYLLLGLNVLKVTGRQPWSLGENLAATAFAVAVLLATWIVANLLRRRRPLARPERIGRAELAVFVVAPAIPSIAFGQWTDGVETVVAAIAILAVVWGVTSYGVWSLLRWAIQRTFAQLALLFNVVVRALPLLLLFTTFLFINAEVWQVAGTLTGVVYAAVLGTFFVLGAVFVLSRVPALMRSLNTFDDWDTVVALSVGTPAEGAPTGRPPAPPIVDRPSVRQRLNIGLVTVFSQAIQVTLVALILAAFFVVFGVLAIPEDTIRAWTALADVHVYLRFGVGDRELVLTEPLLRVSAFLGAFTGMYFTVQLSTDASYRDEFAEDVAPQLRQALAVRSVYRRALGSAAREDEGRG
jgi:hypothetical protein